MNASPSSTSSSDARPGWGWASAFALLAALRVLHPSPPGAAADKPPTPFHVDLSRLAGTAPEVLVVGDSRASELRYAPFAGTYAPGAEPPLGGVWGERSGAVPEMLAFLEENRIRPRILVVCASPASMALRSFLRAAGADGDSPSTRRGGWDALWRAAARPLSFLPRKRGPNIVAEFLDHRIRIPAGERAEEAFSRAPPPNIGYYRGLFAHEPVADPSAVEATVSALRRFRKAGSSVVLVRLPVGPQMLAMEDGWGAAGVLLGIAKAAGAPYVDLTRHPIAETIRPALLDESHVQVEVARVWMSEEAGRQVRSALAGR